MRRIELRPGGPTVVPTAGPRSRAVRPDPAAHLDWARGIARGVGRDYHFGRGSQEEQDLESVAYLVVCEYALRFDERTARTAARSAGTAYDAAGAFRGWCDIEVRSRCRREAVRMRNGGTFHTTRDTAARRGAIAPLPRCPNCADVLAAGSDRRRVVEEDAGEEWSVYDVTPEG